MAVGDVRLALMGAPLDTGNLGVSALGLSMLSAVARRRGDVAVTLFDNGWGVRRESESLPGGDLLVTRRGMRLSRRVHRPESLWQMLAASSLPGGSALNRNVRAIAESAAVWDISGGDSFSDLYGQKRYTQMTLPKRITLRAGTGLVLLPQTYGPFRTSRTRLMAREIVLGATEAWARDAESFERLQELLGDDFDPTRHRVGVDVAFTLPPARPPEEILEQLSSSFASSDPIVGVNVSGLLAGRGARDRYGLAADHESVMADLVRRLLQQGCLVVLVPHVFGRDGEGDDRACLRLAQRLDAGPRLTVLGNNIDARSAKWIIGRFEWMTGARMHATIAALSSETPVTGIAYSDKMHGVFATCGVRDQVVDARVMGHEQLVGALLEGFESRDEVRDRLARQVPQTVNRAETVFDDLVRPLPLS